MARRDNRDEPRERGDRWTERLAQWREGRNAQYQSQGWAPDRERDSSLGEYYPADEFYEYPEGSFQERDLTGGGQPRSLADDRERGYQAYREAPGDYDREGRDWRSDRRTEQNTPYRARSQEAQGQYYDPGYGSGDWHSEEFRGAPYESSRAFYGAGAQGRRSHHRGYEAYRDWHTGGREQSTVNYRGRGPKGYQRSDERILEDICERLTEDPFIDASDIHIEVVGGRVTLEGQVYNRAMKHRAEDLVADCTGVKDIDNRLTLQNNLGTSNRTTMTESNNTKLESSSEEG